MRKYVNIYDIFLDLYYLKNSGKKIQGVINKIGGQEGGHYFGYFY